jgi:chemotaxis signal transduction protein
VGAEIDRQRMESVWRGRADRLAKSPVLGQSGQNELPVVSLGIEKERYAVDLADVAEVLPPVRITPVPGVAAVFAGVIGVHGEIRPVIDLRRLLGMGGIGNGDRARVILLRRDGREMGLRVDSVEQIEWIRAGDLESAADRDAATAQRTSSKFVRRTTKDLLMLLSTEALFAELEL